jgi:hypothetical protein
LQRDLALACAWHIGHEPFHTTGGPVTASLTHSAGQELVQVNAVHSAHAVMVGGRPQVPVDPGGVAVLEVEVAAGP